jgi:hypothetical protein
MLCNCYLGINLGFNPKSITHPYPCMQVMSDPRGSGFSARTVSFQFSRLFKECVLTFIDGPLQDASSFCCLLSFSTYQNIPTFNIDNTPCVQLPFVMRQ